MWKQLSHANRATRSILPRKQGMPIASTARRKSSADVGGSIDWLPKTNNGFLARVISSTQLWTYESKQKCNSHS